MKNLGNRVFLNVDYYQILRVHPWATDDEMIKAYRRLQLKHHTDKNGDLSMCLLLNEIKRILLDKELRRAYDTTRDYADVKVQFQNESSAVCFAKLPCPAKISDDILKDIAKWKDEFKGMEFKDNIQESMTKILDEIINNRASAEENDDFYCKICDKLFVSEDDHFDNVLEPYIHELIGNENADNDAGSTPKIFNFLLKKLELHDKCELSTTESKDFATLVSDAEEALRMKEVNKAFNLYHEAVAILSAVSDSDEHDVVQKLLSIIIKVFANDQYSLVEACKCLLESYIGQFGSSETIQDIFRRKFMSATDLSSYKMASASLHYLSSPLNSDTWDEFVSWERTLFYDGIKEAMSNADLDSLLEILKLVNSRTVTPTEMFLTQKHQEYDLTGITGDYKVAILLIEGAVAKQKGEVTSAADIFQETLQLAASCSNPHISKQIINMAAELCADPVFHHSLRINAWTELIHLKSMLVDTGEIGNVQHFPSFLSSMDPATPGQVTLGRLFSPAVILRVALKNEAAIALRFKHSNLKKALAYFDLSKASGHPSFLISCYQQAVCYLLKEMECLDSNDKATMYAYSKVIEGQCNVMCQVASLNGEPHMNISVHRFILSALLDSVKALAGCVTPQLDNPNSEISYKEIMSPLFARSMNYIWTLQKVNPLIMSPCSVSLSDQLILDEWTNAFQIAFIEAKVNLLHCPEYFPDHLYYYHQFDGVWCGWNRSERATDFHESRLRTMMSLLNSREWDIAEVENTMGWPLIRTTDDGWKNNTEFDLNFDEIPESDVFTSCNGFELNFKTGEFEIYFDQGRTGDLKLFSTNDLAEIFENCIDYAFFTLEDPDPSLHSHPFQEFKYWPQSLTDTDYLYTLLHADLLLKEFTTGVEINTLAPFDLRPAKDGFMKRLPLHLQSLLIPILERRRDPINFKSNANRFWIQIESIECKIDESTADGSFKYTFGHVTAKVNTHVLTRGLDGKYKDAEEKQILDSAENQFARAFTKHYDEIGKYFPILLRLKELAKIGTIRNRLGIILRDKRASIDVLTLRDETSEIFENTKHRAVETITSFRDRSWDPPHPIYTEERVNTNFTETLRLNDVLGKEHLLAPGEIDRVRQNIRNSLREADSSRFQFCANELGRVFQIPSDHLQPYIRGWFDRNSMDTSTLERLCTDGLIQMEIKSLRVFVSSLEEGGIFDRKDYTADISMENYGECSWVPASFWKEFGHPIEPPLLSDESDVEYVDEFDDDENNDNSEKQGSADTEHGELHPSDGRSIQTQQDLQLPCENATPAIRAEGTSMEVSTLVSTSTAKRIQVDGKLNDAARNEKVPTENETHNSTADEGNARATRRTKKRKIRTPRLNKPPRIYGGIEMRPSINWVDVGLTVLGLFAFGGKLLRSTYKVARTVKTAKIAAKGIQTNGTILTGVNRYSILTKQNNRQFHAHHSVSAAYNSQFGIKKGDGISILMRKDVHTSVHSELLKVQRAKGILPGYNKTPKFDPNNQATYPRDILGQMTGVERQVLRQKGLYGRETRGMLMEKIQQNKTTFKEMYDKGLFDPKNPPKY